MLQVIKLTNQQHFPVLKKLSSCGTLKPEAPGSKKRFYMMEALVRNCFVQTGTIPVGATHTRLDRASTPKDLQLENTKKTFPTAFLHDTGFLRDQEGYYGRVPLHQLHHEVEAQMHTLTDQALMPRSTAADQSVQRLHHHLTLSFGGGEERRYLHSSFLGIPAGSGLTGGGAVACGGVAILGPLLTCLYVITSLHAPYLPQYITGRCIAGGGPQQWVLVLCCKAAQHVADVVCAQHRRDAQAGGQQTSQGALARPTGASKQHCHTGALLLNAAEHQHQGSALGSPV
ncbi:MAG: hypothetical protein FRX49_12430 [Trebouxia sp. A1-2]|nr:MAG: hypothetical protein FRX49_12430 [Trebouxia sp. A1-2]